MTAKCYMNEWNCIPASLHHKFQLRPTRKQCTILVRNLLEIGYLEEKDAGQYFTIRSLYQILVLK